MGDDDDDGAYEADEERGMGGDHRGSGSLVSGDGGGGGGYDSDIHFDSDIEGMRVATVDVEDLLTSDDGGGGYYGGTTTDDGGMTTDDSAPRNSGSRHRSLALQALDETSTHTASYDEEIMGVLGHVRSPSADSEEDEEVLIAMEMSNRSMMELNRSSADSPRSGLQMS